jgi:hypothetical protein
MHDPFLHFETHDSVAQPRCVEKEHPAGCGITTIERSGCNTPRLVGSLVRLYESLSVVAEA